MKGLSPLIATIMLIAIVIAIGAIIFAWNQGFLKNLFSIVGEAIEQLLFCSNARVELADVGFEQDNITGKILNIGSGQLRNIKVEFESQNEIEIVELCGDGEATSCEKSNLTVPPGKIVSFSVKPSFRPSLISVLTNCQNAKDSVEFSAFCLAKTESCYSNWQCCSGYCREDIGDQDGICDNGEKCYCCENGQCAHEGNCYNNLDVIYVGEYPPYGRYQCRDGSWYGPY
jgi:flagellin-like protein